MTIHRALIVDDSKTAQYKLLSLLKSYDLQVDCSKSAEEALGYLSYNMPTVIFMDHHMEGMDGLEALKTLKANPSTSTIPVIMYTSNQGGLYAGQAHALGALDIISKEIMHPSTVEGALSKIGIYPKPKYDLITDEPAQKQAIETPEPEQKHQNGLTTSTPIAPTHSIESQIETLDTVNENDNIDKVGNPNPDEIKTQVARLFELHIADVRTQISKNSKFMLRKLIGEIKRSSQTDNKEASEPKEALIESPNKPSQLTRFANSSNILLLLIFVALLFIGLQQSKTRSDLDQLEQNFAGYSGPAEQQAINNEVVFASLGNRQSGNPDLQNFASTLSWAMNANLTFGYEEQAINDELIMLLQNLVYQLNNLGFTGLIALNVHLGNFCVQPKGDNQWQLAESNLPASDCQFLQELQSSVSVDDYITRDYVQFEQTTAPIRNGLIEILISTSEYDEPRSTYPNNDALTTAAQWNAIALKNNRLSISIEPNL